MIPNLIRLIYSFMYLNFSLAAHKGTANTRFSVDLLYYLFIYLNILSFQIVKCKSLLLKKSFRSSNVNEVIGAISNLFISFYKKILHTQKAQKAQKVQRHNQAKAQKAQKRN